MQPSAPAPKGLGTILSVVAVVLAAVALVASIAIPGPTGPAGPAGTNGTNGANGATGATGPQGPAGPGTLMNSSVVQPYLTGGLPLVGCTNVVYANLTIPRPGTVVVTATLHVWIDHTTGTLDRLVAETSNSTTDCAGSLSVVRYAYDLPANYPTNSIVNVVASFSNAFPVTAGPVSFNLNMQMTSGQSAGDAVSQAGIVVVFYPS